ncbi:MAG: helix-turn-helix transcriptional regulator [Alphaproteobacteria bacterium]|nr:helix-turn-helix transcriptional regulator [Alphaproteobacteria bacterium]MBL7097093.1 helix-turn-helix transcriptional regulator [Alphaproteobacteria bacterium]
MSQAQLAKLLGITQPALHQIETGPATRSKHITGIARHTGATTDWLESEKGAPPMPGDAPGIEGADDRVVDPRVSTALHENETLFRDAMPRDIPVYGSGQGGSDGSFEFNTGDPIDFVRRPPRLAGMRDAYAIYLTGESMVPWREEGQPVYAVPSLPVRVMDYVVLQLKPRHPGDAPFAYVKRLLKRTGTQLIVEQFNPPKKLSFPMDKVHTVHRIMDWSDLLGL